MIICGKDWEYLQRTIYVILARLKIQTCLTLFVLEKKTLYLNLRNMSGNHNKFLVKI